MMSKSKSPPPDEIDDGKEENEEIDGMAESGGVDEEETEVDEDEGNDDDSSPPHLQRKLRSSGAPAFNLNLFQYKGQMPSPQTEVSNSESEGEALKGYLPPKSVAPQLQQACSKTDSESSLSKLPESVKTVSTGLRQSRRRRRKIYQTSEEEEDVEVEKREAKKKIEEIICPFDNCGKKFRTAAIRDSHIRNHHPDTTKGKDDDEAETQRKTSVNVSKRRKFECKVCSKIFSEPYNLTRHQRIHSGETPFVCSLCDKAFYRMDSYTLHIQRHSKTNKNSQGSRRGSSSLSKNRDVGKEDIPLRGKNLRPRRAKQRSFYVSYASSSEDSSPSSPRPVKKRDNSIREDHNIGTKIPVRQENSANLEDMITSPHRSQVSDTDSRGSSNKQLIDSSHLECSACKKVCKDRNDLKEHLLVHAVEKPFFCVKCFHLYSSVYNLARHIKTNHPKWNETNWKPFLDQGIFDNDIDNLHRNIGGSESDGESDKCDDNEDDEVKTIKKLKKGTQNSSVFKTYAKSRSILFPRHAPFFRDKEKENEINYDYEDILDYLSNSDEEELYFESMKPPDQHYNVYSHNEGSGSLLLNYMRQLQRQQRNGKVLNRNTNRLTLQVQRNAGGKMTVEIDKNVLNHFLQPISLINVEKGQETETPAGMKAKNKIKESRTSKRSDFEKRNLTSQPTSDQSNMSDKTRFKCLHCAKTFSRRDSLVAHMRIHTGDRDMPYKCLESECNKRFRLKTQLMQHNAMEHNGRRVQCSMCNASFSRKDTLLKHIQRVHTVEVRNVENKEITSTAPDVINDKICVNPSEVENGHNSPGILPSKEISETNLEASAFQNDPVPLIQSFVNTDIGNDTVGQELTNKEVALAEPELLVPKKFTSGNDAMLTSLSDSNAESVEQEHNYKNNHVDNVENKLKESMIESAVAAGVSEHLPSSLTNVEDDVKQPNQETANNQFKLKSGQCSKIPTGKREKTHQCSECQKVFAFAGPLKNHLAKKHKINVSDIPIPSNPMSSDKSAVNDSPNEIVIKDVFKVPVPTTSAGASLKEPSAIAGTAETNKLECPTCKRTFLKRKILQIHMKIHATQTASTNPNEANLQDSEKECTEGKERNQVKEAKPNQCNVCDMTFKYRYSLVGHMRIHTGEKLRCSVCNKGYNSVGGLRYHKLKTHGNTEMNNPGQSQNQEETTPTSLDNDACSRASVIAHTSAILANMTSTSPETSPLTINPSSSPSPSSYFKCSHCDRKFRREDLMMEHMKTHDIESIKKSKGTPISLPKTQKKKQLSPPSAFKPGTSVGVQDVHNQYTMKRGQTCCPYCGEWFSDAQRLSLHIEGHLRLGQPHGSKLYSSLVPTSATIGIQAPSEGPGNFLPYSSVSPSSNLHTFGQINNPLDVPVPVPVLYSQGPMFSFDNSDGYPTSRNTMQPNPERIYPISTEIFGVQHENRSVGQIYKNQSHSREELYPSIASTSGFSPSSGFDIHMRNPNANMMCLRCGMYFDEVRHLVSHKKECKG